MLTVEWTETALTSLETISAYLSERHSYAADNLIGRIREVAESLPLNPYIYRIGTVSGTREAVVHPNYILIYQVLTDCIVIINVLHARQQYP
ncbi:hypothetical protein LMG33810_001710 [Carnimonas sp. LMG 33810]